MQDVDLFLDFPIRLGSNVLLSIEIAGPGCSSLCLFCILRYLTGKVRIPLLTNTSYQLRCLQDTSVFTQPIDIAGTALEWRCTAIIIQVHI